MSVLTNVGPKSINREFQTQPYRSFNNYQKQIDTNRTLENVLDPGVSGRLFSNESDRITLEEWRHSSDRNKIDGGKVFRESIIDDSIAVLTITTGKLDSGTTDRMFTSSTEQGNIENWIHSSDVTLIDGGKIYANSILLSNVNGDLDDISNGSSYGRVALTVIDGGMIKILRRSADATERLEITAGGVEGYANNVKNFQLGSGVAYLGNQSNEHIKLSSSGLEIKDSSTVLATYGAAVTIGEVGASKSNVHITAGELQLRVNTTPAITLDTSGNIGMVGGMTISGTGGWIKVYDDQGSPQLRVHIGFLS